MWGMEQKKNILIEYNEFECDAQKKHDLDVRQKLKDVRDIILDLVDDFSNKHDEINYFDEIQNIEEDNDNVFYMNL